MEGWRRMPSGSNSSLPGENHYSKAPRAPPAIEAAFLSIIVEILVSHLTVERSMRIDPRGRSGAMED